VRPTGGATLREALEQLALAMFGYMTELETVAIDPAASTFVEATGHDLLSLIFNFLDELLYTFHTEDLVVRDIKILELTTPPAAAAATAAAGAAAAVGGVAGAGVAAGEAADGDEGAPRPRAAGRGGPFRLRAACKGEAFDLAKHPQGTEVKAITYSAMQVHGLDDPAAERIDLYVIIDI
jgi:SHS2 domain-containing protein